MKTRVDASRRRITQACLRCRGQKVKCTGQQPCPRCTRLQQPCAFPDRDLRKKGKDVEARLLAEARGREDVAVSTPAPTPRVAIAQPSSLPEHAAAVAEPALTFDAGEAPTPAIGEYSSRLHLQYVRPFGPTAIQPGSELIHISMRAGESPPAAALDGLPPLLAYSPVSDPWTLAALPPAAVWPVPVPGSPSTSLFEAGSDLPLASVSRPLLRLFFEHLGCHFPFLPPDVDALQHTAASQPDAVLLLNVVCALAARFSDDPALAPADASLGPFAAGAPFADKAKQLVIHTLAWPTARTIASLLMLAWYSFGRNSEAELWMYEGMALRMAVDLGLHRALDHSPQDRLLFWSVVMLDRTLAIGTGRTTTIKDADITCPLPCEADLDAVFALAAMPLSPPMPSAAPRRPSAFVYAIRQMMAYGRVAELVNGAGYSPTLGATTQPPSRAEPIDGAVTRAMPGDAGSLAALEDEYTQSYNALPDELAWSADNLRAHHAALCGPIYVHLHLWHAGMLILLHRPPLLHPLATAATMSLGDRLEVINHACRTVGEIFTLAEAVSPTSVLANPFTGQPLFVAGCAAIQDYRIRTGKDALSVADATRAGGSRLAASAAGHSSVLAQAAVATLKLCSRALGQQSRYWAGIGWIAAVLDKRSLHKGRVRLSVVGQAVDTYVSAAELTVFRSLLAKMRGGGGGGGGGGVGGMPAAQVGGDVLPDGESLSALLAAFTGDDATPFTGAGFGADDFASAFTLAGLFPDLPSHGVFDA